jgi:uroporphyrinogen decarboxylase
MNSRERVLAAIGHREPDRVPIDLGACHATTVQGIAYGNLKTHLGLTDGHTRVYEAVQQVVEPEWSILDLFAVDAINASREFDPDGWKDWVLPDGAPCQIPAYHDFRKENGDWIAYNRAGVPVARLIEGGTHFTQTRWPLDRDDWPSQLGDLPAKLPEVCWAAMPEPIFEGGLTDDNLERIGVRVRRLRETTDKAIMMPFGGNLFEWGTYLRRFDSFLMDLVRDPLNTERLLDALVEMHLDSLDRLMPVLGDSIDLIQLSDDLGTEAGPFMSPETFRRFFKPRYKAITDHIKKLNPHVAVFLHSCGSIAAVLDDLIEAGIEVINPVQISANNMAPDMLKARFGDSIVFWGGGCDSQHVLSTATPQQIRDEVRRNIEAFAPGGGFVFAPVHNILAEVPPENVVALYEAAREA